MRIEFSRQFIKAYRKCPPEVRAVFKTKLEKFTRNNFDPGLNNHALKGKLSGFRSINITGDWRVIFKEYDQGQTVYLIAIGTHSQLYS